MRGLFLAGIALLAAAVTTQAHTQPTIPKEVRTLDHLRKAFAHHEAKPLPVKAPAMPDTALVVPVMRCRVFIEPEVSDVPAVPGSVPLVAGPAISVATPPPSK